MGKFLADLPMKRQRCTILETKAGPSSWQKRGQLLQYQIRQLLIHENQTLKNKIIKEFSIWK